MKSALANFFEFCVTWNLRYVHAHRLIILLGYIRCVYLNSDVDLSSITIKCIFMDVIEIGTKIYGQSNFEYDLERSYVDHLLRHALCDKSNRHLVTLDMQFNSRMKFPFHFIREIDQLCVH